MLVELVVISGKGGTGKTTLTSSLAYLSHESFVKVDCDVDASNLHLMFGGQLVESKDFIGAKVATIDQNKCNACGACFEVCRYGAIDKGHIFKVNTLRCEGCGACRQVCLNLAISLIDETTGQTYISQSNKGFLSSADLLPGAEGSGKLVSDVRKKAKGIKSSKNYIIDGSPGTGCSVMASITGCDYSIIVTEPTYSGFEDFIRIKQLTEHFGIKTFVVINKFDINQDMTDKIEDYCKSNQLEVIGKIPFDSHVNEAINKGLPIVSFKLAPAGDAIISIWEKLNRKGVLI